MSRTAAPRREAARAPSTVSHPRDPAEQQADRAADVVARGGSVAGWSFGHVPLRAAVHREESTEPLPPTDDEKKEALKGRVEAALETKEGTALKGKLLEIPFVKGAAEFLDSKPGKYAALGGAAVGLGALAATGQPLPIQLPAKSLDSITPGLSGQLTVEGPLDAPTFVGVSFTFKGRAPKGRGRTRPRARPELVRPNTPTAQAEADDRAGIAEIIAQQRERFGTATLVPLTPGAKPRSIDAPKEAPAEPKEDKKNTDDAPVQRAPATATETTETLAGLDTNGIDGALRGGGRPIEPSVRHSMEARFGVDFSGVRLHDGPSAATAAHGLAASAFTVGDHIVLGSGRADPSTAEGRHLLAHELAHVVQQRGPWAAAPVGGTASVRLHRRGIGEWLGIFFGTTEGNWTDRELRAYLDKLTATRRIDGAFDADNKARAIVRKWKAATPGYELTGVQKGLLIDEMIDGPTLNDDENAILDLLEFSDSGDLREIFRKPKARYAELEGHLHGDEDDRLDALVAARFQGGAAALASGDVMVIGAPVPKGAPAFGFDPVFFDAQLDSKATGADIISVIERYSATDRGKVFDHAFRTSLPKTTDERGSVARSALDAEGARKKHLDARVKRLDRRLAKLKAIIAHFFHSEVPASEEELRATTTAIAAGDAEAVKKVLAPKRYEPLSEDRPKVVTPPAPVAPKPTPVKPAQDAADDEADEEEKAAAKTDEEVRLEKEAEERRKLKEEKQKFGPDSEYRADIQAKTIDIIEKKYQKHAVATGTHVPTGQIQPMAGVAKRETDAVFGAFYDQADHPELTFDPDEDLGNLHSWYETFNRDFEVMKPPQRRQNAAKWILYYYQSDREIRAINNKYGAAPDFDRSSVPTNEAARTLVIISEELTKDGVSENGLDEPKTVADKLNATQRAWPGMAGGGQVYVDLYETGDNSKDRRARWRVLQTLIHEYIHTLRSDPYTEYAKSFGRKSVRWNTLVEGVDEVITAVVWRSVAPKTSSTALRTVVEGKANAALPPIDVPEPGHYVSFEEAMRLVALVGLRNVLAAYFLGLVDRIKGPEPPAEAGPAAPKSKAKKATAKPRPRGRK